MAGAPLASTVVEQPPAAQRDHAGAGDLVRGDGVAREGAPGPPRPRRGPAGPAAARWRRRRLGRRRRRRRGGWLVVRHWRLLGRSRADQAEVSAVRSQNVGIPAKTAACSGTGARVTASTATADGGERCERLGHAGVEDRAGDAGHREGGERRRGRPERRHRPRARAAGSCLPCRSCSSRITKLPSPAAITTSQAFIGMPPQRTLSPG